jgi:hypothetical protein
LRIVQYRTDRGVSYVELLQIADQNQHDNEGNEAGDPSHGHHPLEKAGG